MGKVLLSVPNLGLVIGSASGRLPLVVMMQTADQRHLVSITFPRSGNCTGREIGLSCESDLCGRLLW
jgi:hypothetical protein